MTLVSPGCVRLFNGVTNTERNCLKEDRSVFSHSVSSFSPGSPLPFFPGPVVRQGITVEVCGESPASYSPDENQEKESGESDQRLTEA